MNKGKIVIQVLLALTMPWSCNALAKNVKKEIQAPVHEAVGIELTEALLVETEYGTTGVLGVLLVFSQPARAVVVADQTSDTGVAIQVMDGCRLAGACNVSLAAALPEGQ